MNILQTVQLIILIIGTIFILYVSRKSLKSLKAHGFYRFFVFESILILILVNIPYWYADPFSTQQIISWIILFNSLYLVIESARLLKRIGGSQKRENTANYKFENTANLVKVGLYKYIRHPMYSSLLFLCLGSFLKNVEPLTIILSAAALLFLFLTAKIEEKENVSFFGEQYINYMKETKMFIPFIY